MVGKALNSEKVQFKCINPRDFATGAQHQVDDKPYGGGNGMVMKPEPLAKAIDVARDELPSAPVLCLSPCGVIFNDNLARELSTASELIFVAGRYQGIDERVFESRIDGCISLGNFVTTGGELPSMVVIDALLRHISGIIGSSESVANDSFATANWLAPPCYTRPAVFEGMHVPKVLRSGDHDSICKWRSHQSQQRTKKWQLEQNLVGGITTQRRQNNK